MAKEKKEFCYQALKTKILTLELPAGSSIDETMSGEYGLSRTPFRDILQRLASEGYLTTERHRGSVVSSVSLESTRDFLRTSPMIYAGIAQYAAENRTEAQIEEARRVQAQYREAIRKKDVPAMLLTNHRFHEIIGEMARNPYLIPSYSRLLIDHTRASQPFYGTTHEEDARLIQASSDDHDELIDLIEAGNAAEAMEVTLRHMELSAKMIDAIVRPKPMPVRKLLKQLQNG